VHLDVPEFWAAEKSITSGPEILCIVVTSIFPPTRAIELYSAIGGAKLIVVGDRKSPPKWKQPGATYFSAADQQASGYKLAGALPWNHYCRKLIGYLKAIEGGATVIVDTDDDNLPKSNWGFPAFDGSFDTSPEHLGFVNIYRSFTDLRIWPRGIALKRILDPASILKDAQLAPEPARVGIWQALADGDPDVDAIYRLVNNTPCTFADRTPIVLGRGTVCPFNSQNTAFRRELFPLLYLPALVTFRFTDILRGLIAQPILWAADYRLGFTRATVVQERNPHDYLKDFASEVPCYLHVETVIETAQKVVTSAASATENLHAVYEELVRRTIIPAAEMPILEAWLADLQVMTPR
jgi:hypothetical protein